MEDDQFLKQLLATFQLEAQEYLAAMGVLVRRIDEPLPPPEKAAAVESLFREAHSLKGAARSVNLPDVERLCQSMERVLSAARKGELAVSPDLTAAMREALDALAQLLAFRLEGARAPDAQRMIDVSRRLGALLSGEAPAAAPQPVPAATPAASAPAADTVRIATSRLDALLVQAEELQSAKLGVTHVADDVRALMDQVAAWRRSWDKHARNVRLLRRLGVAQGTVLHHRHRRLLALVLDAFDGNDLVVRGVADRLARLERVATQHARALAGRADRLHDEMKQLLMLPLSNLLLPLQRQVSELGRSAGKDVDLALSGAALEIDRRILEQMKVPMMHILRNAVDHGIETPERRASAGKPARGRIVVEVAAREGNRIEITVADDGAGIDFARAKQSALKLGIVTERALQDMGDAAVADLLFASGLSTSPIITDLSGHGLGLAIVREKIEALGGSISASSSGPGQGTRFTVVLPATLASFRGLVLRLGDRLVVVPSRNVERVMRVKPQEIGSAGECDVVEVEGRSVALASLARLLELREASVDPLAASRYVQLVIACSGDQRLALAVDEIVGDQEVMVKPLVPPLRRVRNVSGATLLGGGTLAPLLNVQDLLKSAALAGRGTARAPWTAPHDTAPLSLLVAEDSPTSRSRIREILESAGYRVTTAADGIEALGTLQSGQFDLLVTDVEMPRLDGFGLTARLRMDKRFSELPVILVTALDTKEDKERGVEVGANAYIVKSAFNQKRLLETVRALV